ncbi:MAG: hypothetical protein IKP86_10195, partial [Anaerolineaceae bacterium]|nr:hypothetical protein [Anaerolineaceae bacterium]
IVPDLCTGLSFFLLYQYLYRSYGNPAFFAENFLPPRAFPSDHSAVSFVAEAFWERICPAPR